MRAFAPYLLAIVFFAVILNCVIRAENRTNCREYSADLQEQGYSKAWANHKANVEYGYSEPDAEYWAIEED